MKIDEILVTRSYIKPATKQINFYTPIVFPAKLILDLIGERESRNIKKLWIPALPPDQVRGAPGMTYLIAGLTTSMIQKKGR